MSNFRKDSQSSILLAWKWPKKNKNKNKKNLFPKFVLEGIYCYAYRVYRYLLSHTIPYSVTFPPVIYSIPSKILTITGSKLKYMLITTVDIMQFQSLFIWSLMTQAFIRTTSLRFSEQIKRHLRPFFHVIFQLLSYIICITGMRNTLVYDAVFWQMKVLVRTKTTI